MIPASSAPYHYGCKPPWGWSNKLLILSYLNLWVLITLVQPEIKSQGFPITRHTSLTDNCLIHMFSHKGSSTHRLMLKYLQNDQSFLLILSKNIKGLFNFDSPCINCYIMKIKIMVFYKMIDALLVFFHSYAKLQ